MFTKLTPLEELKSIYTEILLNKTNKITKITDGSVLNAHSFGASKLSQKVLKDVAILETKMYPDNATGIHLDEIARLWGISPRFGAKQSSTYMLVVGDIGTTYISGTHYFKSDSGIQFDLTENYTIGQTGFGYIKVRSNTTGYSTNVDALSIKQITPIPTGHLYCINEYASTMGTDAEDDDVFRKRIKEGVNLLSKSTIAQIEQVFMKINENVLKVYYGGIDNFGRTVLNVLSENGINFNTPEFNDIVLRSEKYFSLTEFRPSNFNGYGVVLRNVQWQPIDISIRADIDPSYNIDNVRKEMQIKISKYLDYRYFRTGQRVEWDNLLEIAKNTNGVRYVNDYYFFPNNDIPVDIFKLPRIRGFRLMDLNGNILSDVQNNLNPMFYPKEPDFSFIATVLQTI